jgi:1D-myo-inositol 3-kinase
MQAVQVILEEKTMNRSSPCINGATFTLERSNMHDELHASLQEAAMLMYEKQEMDTPNSNGDIS